MKTNKKYAIGWVIFIVLAVVLFLKRKWVKLKLQAFIKGMRGDDGKDGSDGTTNVIINNGGQYVPNSNYPLKIYCNICKTLRHP